MRSLLQTIVVVVVVLVAGSTARAGDRHHRYFGMHPIAHGGGLCLIEGPHVHVYEPDRLQYRDHHGFSVFVGDPTVYGYRGPKYAYKGHHPVHVDVVVGDHDPDVEYCYLDGPHYHAFAPPAGELVQVDGVFFYTGKPPKAYFEARPKLVAINAVYAPIAHDQPVVTAVAPVGWIGARVDVVVPIARPHVHVAVPTLVIEHDHHHHHGKWKWKKHHRHHRHHHDD